MKKYLAPELEIAKFSAQDVITASGDTNANIIGGDGTPEGDTNAQYNGVVNFDWSQANWD